MSFFTVRESKEVAYEIKRSVFICNVAEATSAAEGAEFVQRTRKKYSDATHNCYAYICLDGQKFSDDGEPQGTAGQPILQTLKLNDLNNVVCVVTRYFGGIKLGAGGLCAAYRESVVRALEQAGKIEVFPSVYGRAQVEYGAFGSVSKAVGKYGKVLKTEFGDGAEIYFAAPEENFGKLEGEIVALTSGKAEIFRDWTGLEKY